MAVFFFFQSLLMACVTYQCRIDMVVVFVWGCCWFFVCVCVGGGGGGGWVRTFLGISYFNDVYDECVGIFRSEIFLIHFASSQVSTIHLASN